MSYAQNHKELLMTYLEDGKCSILNNQSENGICSFTVGRKNWLFGNTPQGPQTSAMVYTMVEMARADKLNIYKYLKYLLEKLPDTKLTDTELGKLCPWNEEVIVNCSSTTS